MKLAQQEFHRILDSVIGNNVHAYVMSASLRIKKELAKGTLEIEGYERDEWHKIDLKDPSTFPPPEKEIYVCYDGDYPSVAIILNNVFYEPRTLLVLDTPTHWRKLPRPPQED